MTIKEKEEELLQDYTMFDDWNDKYAQMMELVDGLEELPGQYKDDDHLVVGCQSQTWVGAKEEEGKVHLYMDCEAAMGRALGALLFELVQGRTKEEIEEYDFGLVERMGLYNNLSPTRAHGLKKLIEKIKKTASEA